MARSTSKDQDSTPSDEGTAESTTTADQSGIEQQAGPPSGTTAPSALTSSDVPGPDEITLPKGGVEALRERLGTDLNEYGAELARRVLGELHIHRNGGVPASQIALEAQGQLEDGDAEYWNSTGQELAQKDFVGLNQRGSFFAPLPQQATAQEQEQTQPQDGAPRSAELRERNAVERSGSSGEAGRSAARSPQAPPLPPGQAPADQQAAP